MARKAVYPLYRKRLILRGVSSVLLLIAVALYVSDGVQCGQVIDEYDYGFESYIASSDCWTGSLFGDLRPVITVRNYQYSLRHLGCFAATSKRVDLVGAHSARAQGVVCTGIVNMTDLK